MTKTEKEHIDALTKELKAQYGPVMRAAQIRDFLHLKTPSGTSAWLSIHGLAGRQAYRGVYYTADVARAFVMGAV